MPAFIRTVDKLLTYSRLSDKQYSQLNIRPIVPEGIAAVAADDSNVVLCYNLRVLKSVFALKITPSCHPKNMAKT